MDSERRVLLVEDDEDTVRLLSRSLSKMGLQVDWASNGEEAILVTQNNLPELILMDIMMPRLDGFETTRYLKRRYPDQYVPILIVTARDDAESMQRAQQVGADHYLTKPVRFRDLEGAVRMLLDLKSAENDLSATAPNAGDPADSVEANVGAGERVVDARSVLAQALGDLGLVGLAKLHLARMRALAPEDERVRALARRLGE